MRDVYRLIYTSRDLIAGDAEAREREVDAILDACRRNNRRDGVTGALLLGAGTFAQILEGERGAVEATFERIQCDPRHGDIDVLQCETVPDRMFPDWDMALVGRSERGRLLWKDLSRDSPVDLSRLDGDSLCSAVLAMVQVEEPTPIPGPEKLGAEIDARRRLSVAVRADAGPGASRPEPPRPPDAGEAVLRAALDEERGRTTALRRALDEARVALARAASEAEALARHRDIWADRGRQLRSSLAAAREALAAAAAARGGAEQRLALCEAELGRSRADRDVWAECARALAAALRVEPTPRTGEGAPERERPPLKAVPG